MKQQLTFVEKARAEVEDAPLALGDEVANALLAEARERIYHWPHEFGGFSAELVLIDDSQTWRGQLTAADSQHFEFVLDAPLSRELSIWLNYQLGELLAHREAPTRSRMASRSGVVLGDDHPIYGPQIIFPDDPMHSSYRIRDQRITQIARSYPKQRFVINMDSHYDFDGRYAAQCYSAFYWDRANGDFKKSETYFDAYHQVDGFQLPTLRRYSMASQQGLANRELRLTSHCLLNQQQRIGVKGNGPDGCPFH